MPFDVDGLEEWITKIEKAEKAMKTEAADTLEDIGDKFLDLVQANIKAAKNIDTRLLLSSFHRGSANNIWELDSGDLTLTVGSSLEYAQYVNAGHSQQPGRFIPGTWNGNRFTYIPGAKTGMVLKASYVEGSKYFDKAEQEIQRNMDDAIQKAFDKFWKKYFA